MAVRVFLAAENFFRHLRAGLWVVGLVLAGAEAQVVPAVMTPSAAREEIAALRIEIARHDALYHRQAAPEISDGVYDGLKRKLREWEQTYPEIAREVPAVRATSSNEVWPVVTMTVAVCAVRPVKEVRIRAAPAGTDVKR